MNVVDGTRLLEFCRSREAVLVGAATRSPLSAKNLVFVFPPSVRKHSPPGVTSSFVKDIINEFYPCVHPTFKEHVATVSAAFLIRGDTVVKTVQMQDSDHQYRIDHDKATFCFSYSRIRASRELRSIFGSEVFVNLDY